MRNLVAVVLSLCVAIVLALLPMPDWSAWLRPSWVLMVMIFWTMTIPFEVNVGVAWLAGMILDLLTGCMLGEHALALTIVVYFSYRFHLRLNMYPLIQQAFTVFIFTLIYQLIIYCLQSVINQPPASHLYWMSSVTSMLFWPWLFIMMRDYCSRFRVAIAE